MLYLLQIISAEIYGGIDNDVANDSQQIILFLILSLYTQSGDFDRRLLIMDVYSTTRSNLYHQM